MSYDKDILISAGRTRRGFIKSTILAAAGTSTAAGLTKTALSCSPPRAATESCPAAKAPMQNVAGKVAFITGGSSGIGLGIARAFAAADMKVVIGYRTESHLDESMRQLGKAGKRVHPIRVDVTDRAGMERAAAEAVQVFGKVHVLVNNAGVVLPPALSATSYQDWDWVLNVNLNGPFNGVRAFLPLIRSHGEGGHVITTSSVMGLFAVSASAAYTASKFAVVGMMEALRAELADTNIGVSVFCPGMVDSKIEESSFRNRPADSAVKDDPEIIERAKRVRRDRELTMDPLEAGQLVLRGMRSNDLYIFTHPEFESILKVRAEAMMISLPRDLSIPEKRIADLHSAVDSSIYAIERDRRLCGQTGPEKQL